MTNKVKISTIEKDAVSLPIVVEPPILTCGYCGSNNCGSLYGDPVCHELD